MYNEGTAKQNIRVKELVRWGVTQYEQAFETLDVVTLNELHFERNRYNQFKVL